MSAAAVRPLQCQAEAARFATRTVGLDEIRGRAVRSALDHLVAGHRDAALEAMLDGLARQAPLTFRRGAIQ